MVKCPTHRLAKVEAMAKVPSSGNFAKASALLASLIAAGVLTGESVSVHAHTWLSWFALIPVFIAIRFLKPSLAAVCGAIWGFSIYAYSAVSGGSGFEPTLLSCLLLTLVPAVYAWFGSHATMRRGFDPLILGLGWAAVEFALAPVKLRYGLIASVQIDNLVLLVVGKTGGCIVVAFLVAFVCATILGAVTDVVCAAAPRSRRLIAAGDSGQCIHLSRWIATIIRYLVPSHPRAPPVLA